jgi:hypothetical protein
MSHVPLSGPDFDKSSALFSQHPNVNYQRRHHHHHQSLRDLLAAHRHLHQGSGPSFDQTESRLGKPVDQRRATND